MSANVELLYNQIWRFDGQQMLPQITTESLYPSVQTESSISIPLSTIYVVAVTMRISESICAIQEYEDTDRTRSRFHVLEHVNRTLRIRFSSE